MANTRCENIRRLMGEGPYSTCMAAQSQVISVILETDFLDNATGRYN